MSFASAFMNTPKGVWATARGGLVIALLLVVASGLSYPGGTLHDESTRGYSFTHNFLSDLGTTVALNYQRNGTGAVLFVVSVVVGVLALGSLIVATMRLLSSAPRARSFARLAAVAGVLACVGFLGAAIAPVDRAWRLHTLSGMVGFRSFPVVTALLAIATSRDPRFRPRAAIGWAALTIALIGLIVASLLGPSTDTDRGLATQVVMQKIMVASMIVVLWFESHEAEIVIRSGIASAGIGAPPGAMAG
jgi:cytochrome bd-type quinol oxidase subunit 2